MSVPTVAAIEKFLEGRGVSEIYLETIPWTLPDDRWLRMCLKRLSIWRFMLSWCERVTQTRKEANDLYAMLQPVNEDRERNAHVVWTNMVFGKHEDETWPG